ncbi:short-chain dehydrogenase [Paenibacillus sambharensis]|uniref:Short-chain dehydrogenase n=1 Tax=Paenibacillus sambharensis TaxID=1803190 RepID=A0A2W1LG22_9BACL|nr:SDR family oxidoreductase [Paenibacillus sambharensis]PZD97649.1 short-chain dehydrogenase [Paenibacillus sambharensis]
MTNKTSYITGCDRGLGLGLARQLLDRGYTVFAGRYMNDWPELDELAGQTDRLHILPLDVTSETSVQEAAAAIRKNTDRLDLLINNAAIFKDRSGDIFGELHFGDMMKLYDTNTLGPLRVTHSVVDLLVKGEDKRLVNISSESGSIANNYRKQEFGYSMSKTAVNMQSVMLQEHLKEYGIKVLAFHPGYVRSYMLGKFNEHAAVEAEDSAKGILKQTLRAHELDGPIYMDYEGNLLPW